MLKEATKLSEEIRQTIIEAGRLISGSPRCEVYASFPGNGTLGKCLYMENGKDEDGIPKFQNIGFAVVAKTHDGILDSLEADAEMAIKVSCECKKQMEASTALFQKTLEKSIEDWLKNKCESGLNEVKLNLSCWKLQFSRLVEDFTQEFIDQVDNKEALKAAELQRMITRLEADAWSTLRFIKQEREQSSLEKQIAAWKQSEQET